MQQKFKVNVFSMRSFYRILLNTFLFGIERHQIDNQSISYR